MKKNSIQVRVNEYNQKRKAVDSVLKNHKSLSIKAGIYPDISVQIRPSFCPFSVCKVLVMRPGTSKLGLHKAIISSPIV